MLEGSRVRRGTKTCPCKWFRTKTVPDMKVPEVTQWPWNHRTLFSSELSWQELLPSPGKCLYCLAPLPLGSWTQIKFCLSQLWWYLRLAIGCPAFSNGPGAGVYYMALLWRTNKSACSRIEKNFCFRFLYLAQHSIKTMGPAQINPVGLLWTGQN